jgi:hypothetical protein
MVFMAFPAKCATHAHAVVAATASGTAVVAATAFCTDGVATS